MRLIKLKREYFDRFRAMSDDFLSVGDDRYAKHTSAEGFRSYLEELRRFEDGRSLPVHLVQSFAFFLEVQDGTLVGGIRLRPALNESLLIEGGHLGYDIRPACRNKGYATRMVELVIPEARRCGLRRLLLTCFQDNAASERVILKCGGVLESIEPSPRNGRLTKRFWIDIGHDSV